MTRTDDDTWDITESVGATALGVAAARAAETESAEPLFQDPFARVFLDAAGEGTWNIFDHLAVARVDPGTRGADADVAGLLRRPHGIHR